MVAVAQLCRVLGCEPRGHQFNPDPSHHRTNMKNITTSSKIRDAAADHVFFTADTHLGHNNIRRYCNRPFDSVEEMNDTIIENWNSKVKKNDYVYHLGDFCFGDPHPFITRLNGFIFFIRGNHDKSLIDYINRTHRQDNFDGLPFDTLDMKIEGQFITLSHYAMRVWNKSHFNSWHLYGHSHNTLPSQGKSFDVGVDGHNFYPWSFKEIKDKMKTLPDNINWVKKLPGYDEVEFQEEKAKDNDE